MSYRKIEEALSDLSDSVTPFMANKTAEQSIEFAIDPSKGLTKKRYAWYSNNTLFDNSLISDIEGGLQLSTGSNGSDSVRIRSVVPGEYRSQTLAVPGVGFNIEPETIEIDSDKLVSTDSGVIAIGAGWHDNSAGGWDVNGASGTIQTFFGFKIDPDGTDAVLVSQGQHKGDSPVPQEEWNIDTLDGSSNSDNPSGLEFRPDNGYIWNGPYTWYNQGALVMGFVSKERNKFIPAHRFEIDGVPSIDRPNMPTTVIVDNDGAADSTNVKVGGMQFSRYGSGDEKDVRLTPLSRVTSGNYVSDTVATNGNNAVAPRDEPGKPLVSARKVDDLDDTTAIGNTIEADSVDNVYIFAWDEYEPDAALTGANFRDPSGVDADETKLEVDTAATDYTPQTALLRGWAKLGGEKRDAQVGVERTDDRVPIDATRIYTVVNDGSSTDLQPFKVNIQESF